MKQKIIFMAKQKELINIIPMKSTLIKDQNYLFGHKNYENFEYLLRLINYFFYR